MSVGIDPLVDFACRKLLGSPEHPAITLHFLNAVLTGGSKIVDVEILNPMIDKEFEDDKYSILDVRARDSNGRRFNIEIQRTIHATLAERLAFYTACQLVEQLSSGDGYDALRPSIGICILDRVMFQDVNAVHLDFRLHDPKLALTLTDHLQIHLLQLPKYFFPSNSQSISVPLEQWCYFFRHANDASDAELLQLLPDTVFEEAIGVLKMIARDPQQRQLYELRLKVERDARANLASAIQQGIEQGIEQGRRDGVISKVKLLRDLLRVTTPSDSELAEMAMAQLDQLDVDYERQLRAISRQ